MEQKPLEMRKSGCFGRATGRDLVANSLPREVGAAAGLAGGAASPGAGVVSHGSRTPVKISWKEETQDRTALAVITASSAP